MLVLLLAIIIIIVLRVPARSAGSESKPLGRAASTSRGIA